MLVPEEVDYVIPKGFAAFFRRNDEEAGVIPYRMMAWVNRDNCFDVARSAVHFNYRERLQSLGFLGPLGDEGDYMRADIEDQYQKETDKIFVQEFCAPEGAAEFLGQA